MSKNEYIYRQSLGEKVLDHNRPKNKSKGRDEGFATVFFTNLTGPYL